MFTHKILIGFILALPVFFIAYHLGHLTPPKTLPYISRADVYKNRQAVNCTPDWNTLDADSLAATITILPGWGSYQWTINTQSDSAQLYFQQGINMYYAFHIIESMASFKKAIHFDENNAMLYWAESLAYGPNINDGEYVATPEAYIAAKKAMELSQNCTSKEKALISAISVRYTADSTISRAALNTAYTSLMAAAFKQFPKDADVAALYADAMMIQHPWDYWNHDGTPQAWTPLIITVLEKTIKFTPAHPGANHYYIHTIEASPNPGKALKSANLLGGLMPEVSHMVHMPSHIYIRSGNYAEGIKVNEMSLKGYHDYAALFPEVKNAAPLYLVHNLHMKTACAMLGAGYTYSAESAEETKNSFDTSFLSLPAGVGEYIQYVYATPVLNDVRFGKWEAVLQEPYMPESYLYSNLLQHWAKGMAYARTKKINEAKEELQFIKDHIAHPSLKVAMGPVNPPVAAVNVSAKMLEGVIAEEEGNKALSIIFLKEAVKAEDDMIYNEPKDWLIPVKPYLGAAMLKAGEYTAAEDIFKKDLKENPHNHWALQGLYESLKKQNKTAPSQAIKKQLDIAVADKGMKGLPTVY